MKGEQEKDEMEVDILQMKPRKLNWTKTLFDYHICLDAEAFQKWDGDLTMPSQQILQKDIPRTRCDDPQMKKQNFRQVLRRITTFYCKQNGVTYQQGLLQVVYPFALLRRKQFKTKKCFAYFNAFMRKHFPKVLVQRVVEGKKQLPHAILALTLTDLLLKFHYPILSNCLREHEMPMSLIATQQLLTIFAKNLAIKYVYEIYDYFIQKNNPNYIFYMTVALIGQQQKTILQAAETGLIHKQVQSIKKINSMEDLKSWFDLAQRIEKTTPESFQTMASQQFCFTNRNLLTAEDVQRMLKSQELIGGGYLSIGIQQINKNIAKYVIIILQSQYIKSEQRYTTLTLNPNKLPGPKELEADKIYVLAAHDTKLQEQKKYLTEFAAKFPHLRFLMLKDTLTMEKKKSCVIF